MCKKIQKVISMAAIVAIVSVLALGAFSYFTDYAMVSTSVRAGTLDISLSDVTEDLTAGLGIVNPGDSNDLTFTVNNDGEKSADVKTILTVTSTVAMNPDDHEWKIVYEDENGEWVELPGELSDDGKTLIYSLDSITLNGSIETEDGITEKSHTYNFKFVMDIDAPDTFQGSTATVDIEVNAKQHRNTDGFEDNDQVEIDPANIPMLAANSTWFTQGGTSLTRSSVSEIEIVDSYTATGDEVDSWDASNGMIGTVTAYAVDDGSGNGTYKLTVAGNGNGCVYANPDSSSAFANFTNVTSINNANLLNTSNVTDMWQTFFNCASLVEIDLDNWDASNVTNMSYTFAACSSLQTLNLSKWDVGNVTTMMGMFMTMADWPAMKLTSIGDTSNWDTSNVTNMSGMFQWCPNIPEVKASNWNTSKVTTMQAMFSCCTSLKTLDVSNWDTSNVTTFTNMFFDCENLKSLDVSQWNTGKVTTMLQMFMRCTNLEVLDVSNWDVSNVTNFMNMFAGNDYVGDMKIIPDVSNWDTSSATNMAAMFYGCGQITELNLSKWDVSKVTAMSHMFADNFKLNNINFTGWNTESLTDMDGIFNDCHSIVAIDVSDFDTQNVTKFSQVFDGMESLTTINGLDKWDTSSGEIFAEMFLDCSSLTSLDLSTFNTGNATGMECMFQDCSGLTNINLSSFDTSKVQYMDKMFSGCSNLTSLDLSSFNTVALLDTIEMFANCSNLKTIYVSDTWTIENTREDYAGNEFLGCVNLVGGAGTTYDENNVDKTYAHIDGGAENPGYLTYKATA